MSGSHLQMTENDAYVTRQSSPSHYGYTKAEAEKLVRVARRVLSRNLLRCVAACCPRYIYAYNSALVAAGDSREWLGYRYSGLRAAHRVHSAVLCDLRA